MALFTRLYDSYDDAAAAVIRLRRAGFADSDIGLMARDRAEEAGEDAATGAGLGGLVGAGAGLLAGLGALAIPGIGPVVAAGWLATTAAGAATGAAAGAAAGGIVGALTAEGVDPEDAGLYAESVRRGGAMVSVRTSEPGVERILDGDQSVDVGRRRDDYLRDGWTGFNPALPLYVPPA
jgi:hypothetical protein